MPIYEYQCRKCGAVTEKLEGHSDPPLRKCPSCGGRTERVMSPGAFVFKGSGWYATDYKNRGRDGGGKKEDACPAKEGGAAGPACAACPKAN